MEISSSIHFVSGEVIADEEIIDYHYVCQAASRFELCFVRGLLSDFLKE